jgi:serralysin
VAIAYGSAINEAVGGSGNDAFFVNSGNDIIDGGAGNDVANLYGLAGDWTIATVGTTQTATNIKTGAIETLRNIETIAYYDPTVTIQTHSAPAGMLSQTVSAFVQSVAAMAGQGSASTIIPTNGGMNLQEVMSVTKPV